MYKWNGFADRSFSPAVGCSNVGCTEREVCRARHFAKRQKPQVREFCERDDDGGLTGRSTEYCRGCQECFDFEVHDHWERWDQFRAKEGERVAFGDMGDLFNPVREDRTILRHFKKMCDQVERFVSVLKPRFLIQTRHMARAVDAINNWLRWEFCEFGTTLSSAADLENVKALAELPENVLRFIAFEPCEWILEHFHEPEVWDAIVNAQPNWCYVGFRNSHKKNWAEYQRQSLLSELKRCFDSHCKVIWKPNTGLAHLNEGVTLP